MERPPLERKIHLAVKGVLEQLPCLRLINLVQNLAAQAAAAARQLRSQPALAPVRSSAAAAAAAAVITAPPTPSLQVAAVARQTVTRWEAAVQLEPMAL